MKRWVIIILLCACPAYAAQNLTSAQTERVKTAKLLLGVVDKKSLEQTIKELQGTSYPEGNLQILEAVAKSYVDIIREQNVEGKGKKEWLYSMIQLNMAYFQLGGDPNNREDTSLNLLIRRKLQKYLPAELFTNPKLFHSLE